MVIVSQSDTVYGERATFNRTEMKVQLEGNVRVVAQAMTLYGSHLDYNLATGEAHVYNARLIQAKFNLVARKIHRVSPALIQTYEAEFSTCRDCPESWSIYGKQISIYTNDRAVIRDGLARIKGVSLLYIPYISIPLTKRKTGFLFPIPSSRLGEGVSYQQPFFWAMNDSKDMTIAPTLWASRGWGGDGEFRQRFAPDRWVEVHTRMVSDKIYEPTENNTEVSGQTYNRAFGSFENHWYWSPNWVQHLHMNDMRDLDMIRDYPDYAEAQIMSSDLGFRGHLDGRGERWALSVQSQYLRNQLFNDPEKFDRRYVQTLPRVAFHLSPQTLFQTPYQGLRHLQLGVDSSFSRFRQVEKNDQTAIRNADRFSAMPYLNWHMLNWGPFKLKSSVVYDYQSYQFPNQIEDTAFKYATLMKTELSFSMDKQFGIAFSESIPRLQLSEEQRQELEVENKDNNQNPQASAPKKPRDLIGDIPEVNSQLLGNDYLVARNAYRHAQEFKLIHHSLSGQGKGGNPTFLTQITDPTGRGVFDAEDAIRSQSAELAGTLNRSLIPPQNSLEFQWNNLLIKKTPKQVDWLRDQRYLKDNFSYQKLAYFDVSQGLRMEENEEFETLTDRLTRLSVQAGLSGQTWSLNLSEFFYHQESAHSFQLSGHKRFSSLNLLAAYNLDDVAATTRNILKAGVQVRPWDHLGLNYVRQINLDDAHDERNIYALDIMPASYCWNFVLQYEDTQNASRFMMNVMFNYGSENFEAYRRDWFSFQRF